MIELGGALAGTTALGVLIAFMIINLLLGCESWDQSYWTETNSCLTITMIWDELRLLVHALTTK